MSTKPDPLARLYVEVNMLAGRADEIAQDETEHTARREASLAFSVALLAANHALQDKMSAAEVA